MGVGQITSVLLIFIGKLSNATQNTFTALQYKTTEGWKKNPFHLHFALPCLASEIKNQHHNDSQILISNEKRKYIFTQVLFFTCCQIYWIYYKCHYTNAKLLYLCTVSRVVNKRDDQYRVSCLKASPPFFTCSS